VRVDDEHPPIAHHESGVIDAGDGREQRIDARRKLLRLQMRQSGVELEFHEIGGKIRPFENLFISAHIELLYPCPASVKQGDILSG